MAYGLNRRAFDRSSYDYWGGKYGTINVRDFGAVGDGAHDDTAAIQNAINTAGPLMAGVYLPPGTYMVSRSLVLSGGMQLIGSGHMASILQLQNGANCDILTTPNDGVQRYGLELRNFGIKGNAANQTMGDAIHLFGMNECNIFNVYILDPYGSGIHVGDPTQAAGMYNTVPMITNCKLRGLENTSTGHGIFLDTGSSDAILNGNDVGWFSSGGGITLSSHDGSVLSGNNCWQCKNGFYFYLVSRCRIVGCLSDLALQHGYVIQESNELQLSACESRESGQSAASTYASFFMQGASGQNVGDVIMVGCSAFASQASGIDVFEYAGSIRIVGCDVDNTAGGLSVGSTGISAGAVHVSGTAGLNPAGVLTAPAIPASGTAQANAFPYRVRAFISGGTVTAIAINGTTTGLIIGTFELAPGETVTLTYSAAPSWTWFGL